MEKSLLLDISTTLVVDERKSSDQFGVSLVKSSKTLGIVTNELEEGKHSNTSVLKLSSLTLGKNIIRKINDSSGGGEPSVNLNSSNEGDDLGPSKEGDGGNSGKSVGDVAGAHFTTRSQVVSESVGLWGNVSENSQLSNTSVLKLSKTVTGELLVRDSIGEASRIPEANRWEGADLVLESVKRGGGLANLSRSKGGSSGEGRGKDDGLHGCS